MSTRRLTGYGNDSGITLRDRGAIATGRNAIFRDIETYVRLNLAAGLVVSRLWRINLLDSFSVVHMSGPLYIRLLPTHARKLFISEYDIVRHEFDISSMRKTSSAAFAYRYYYQLYN